MLKLQEMKIQGFKSFHDRTTLSFDTGMTAVVGPNGCGKSNILDAFSWVLGEQSVKSLRGDRMQDLIFNGTQKRKPLGMAEVSMKLSSDNGALPHSWKKLIVTRRLYRSGESEFLINNKSCRLKDIHEILYGTGIGVKQYSIIEQGKIGIVLNAKPLERRILIEEAAGITGFRSKKRSALLKLEAAESNLARVLDIYEEVGRQMRYLKRQAAKARRFKSLQEELRHLQRIYFGLHSLRVREQLEREMEKSRVADDMLTELEARTSSHEAAVEQLRLAVDEMDRERMSIAEAAHNTRLEIDRHTNRITNNKGTIVDFVKRMKDADRQNLEESGRLASLVERLEERRGSFESLASEFEEVCRVEVEREQDHAKAYKELLGRREEIERLKSEKFECVSRKAVLGNGIENRKREIGQVNVRRERLEAEIAQARAALGELEAAHSGKTAELEASKQEISQLTQASDRLARESGKLKELIGLSDSRLAEEKSRLEDTKRRIESLKELADAGAGAGEGVKAGLRHLKDRGAKGVHGLLANEVEVVQKFETAVESVLGQTLQHVVVDSASPVVEALGFLKEKKLGECAFIVRERAAAPGTKTQQPGAWDALKKEKGVLGPLATKVTSNNGFGWLIEEAARPYIAVDTLDTALRLCDAHGEFDFVTLDGELVRRCGAVAGGRNGRKGAGLLGIRREQRELDKQLPEIKKVITTMERTVGNLRKRAETLESELSGLSRAVHEKEKQSVSLQTEIGGLTKELEKAKNHLGSVDVELAQALDEAALLEKEQAAAVGEHQDLAIHVNRLDSDQNRLAEAILSSEALVADLSSALTQARMDLAARREAKRSAEAELNSLEESVDTCRRRLEDVQGSIESMKTATARLTGEIKDSESALTIHMQELDDQQKQIAEVEERGKDKRERIEAAKKELSELRGYTDKARASCKDFAVSIARKEDELQHTCERCLEELNEDASMVADGLTGEERETDIDGCKESIDRKKDQIEKMGPINLMAVEEYEGLVERHEFLESQTKDLNESIASLKQTIAQIEETSRARFKETFEAVNESFSRAFEILFEGGKAFLELTDKDNLLESGIEIIAQPPGKRLQNILLLSGGEKALAAIALLFALFQYKPSPFCILDEVDAPLDDSNIQRFLRLLRELSAKTQFIMITHSRRTMEWADVLYGVTMEEPGVSKLVSVVFNDAKTI